MSINTCTISGNLTRDAELRSNRAGTNILTFTVAVNDRRKDPQSGEWVDVPNFIDCVVFGNRAERLETMLAKSTKVCVSGKLRWSQWEKDGQKRSKVEVVADEVVLMSRSKPQNQSQGQQSGNYTNPSQNGGYSASQAPQNGYYDEDCPF